MKSALYLLHNQKDLITMKTITLVLCSICLLSSCHDAEKEAQRRELDSLKFAAAKQAVIDSMKAIEVKNEAPIVQYKSTTSKPRRALTNPEKGAIIGGGAGVVVGSAVARDRVAGALVGGVVGAGVGAATGSFVDQSKNKNRKKKTN